MNLTSTIKIYSGGVGSGCKGENCGRPSQTTEQKTISYKIEPYSKAGRQVDFMITMFHPDQTKDNGQIGYMFVKRHGNTMSVADVHLSKDFQGKGFGTQLYNRLKEFAKSQGCKTISSDKGVHVSERAQKIWKKMGGIRRADNRVHVKV